MYDAWDSRREAVTMAALVLLDLNVKPEALADMKAWLKGELGATRAFDGCQGITVHANRADPNNLVLVESWESGEHYDKYLAWRTDRGDLAKLASMLAGEPSIRQFEIVGV